PGAMFPLDAFVVNLSESSARRYLKATIALEFGGAPKDEEVAKKMPQIRDAVIVLLSSKSLDDVASTQGKIQIRKEIMHRVNRIVGEPPVRGVYYTEFVIQ
ncbi:MAG: flagellar basal body-associated FliL family protein, partial [Candidatus Methylomirabilis sp.]|nr:flagellar basal body-associated FliL family protein [Deltaproteobacteria bacterium]